MMVAQSSFSGPLPPPEILSGYDKVLPGAAERILKMAEDQASHRRELERQIVQSDLSRSRLGLLCGLAVSALAIICGTWAAVNGQPWAGAAIGGATVATLIYAFNNSSASRKEELEKKSSQMQKPR